MSWPWGAYLGEEGLKQRDPREDLELAAHRPERDPARREGDRRLPQLDARVDEANRAGYDEAILLTAEGYVADGSGENIFLVKDGAIYTPDLSTSILPGITRDTVIQIAQDLGHTVIEKSLIRSDLYLADEVVHGRHRRRGDAAPRGRRPRDRASGRSRSRSRRRTSTPRAAAASAGPSGSSTPRPRRAEA